jgi:hypothetical protein
LRGVTTEWGSEYTVMVREPEADDPCEWARNRQGLHYLLAQDSLMEVFIHEDHKNASVRFIEADDDPTSAGDYTHTVSFALGSRHSWVRDPQFHALENEPENYTRFKITPQDYVYMEAVAR